MPDMEYCLIDHDTRVFVTSEKVESLILNSFYSPEIKKSLETHAIDYAEWSENIVRDIVEVLADGEAVTNNNMRYTITAF